MTGVLILLGGLFAFAVGSLIFHIATSDTGGDDPTGEGQFFCRNCWDQGCELCSPHSHDDNASMFGDDW